MLLNLILNKNKFNKKSGIMHLKHCKGRDPGKHQGLHHNDKHLWSENPLENNLQKPQLGIIILLYRLVANSELNRR